MKDTIALQIFFKQKTSESDEPNCIFFFQSSAGYKPKFKLNHGKIVQFPNSIRDNLTTIWHNESVVFFNFSYIIKFISYIKLIVKINVKRLLVS